MTTSSDNVISTTLSPPDGVSVRRLTAVLRVALNVVSLWADPGDYFWQTGHAAGNARPEPKKIPKNQNKLSFIQVLVSVFSSFFGVQKDATRERDFTHGRARDFIFVGILLTLLFILAVWGVVQLVMSIAEP